MIWMAVVGCLLLTPPLFTADSRNLEEFAKEYSKRSETRQDAAEEIVETVESMLEFAYSVDLRNWNGWDEVSQMYEYLMIAENLLEKLPEVVAKSPYSRLKKTMIFMDHDVAKLRIDARKDMVFARLEEIAKRSEVRKSA